MPFPSSYASTSRMHSNAAKTNVLAFLPDSSMATYRYVKHALAPARLLVSSAWSAAAEETFSGVHRIEACKIRFWLLTQSSEGRVRPKLIHQSKHGEPHPHKRSTCLLCPLRAMAGPSNVQTSCNLLFAAERLATSCSSQHN